MITAIVGRPGEGKTVYLVHLILTYLRQGLDVYTNVGVKLPPGSKLTERLHEIHSIDEILEIRSSIQKGIFNKAGAKIVLDELQIYINSRNWDKLPEDFQFLLQQHGKRGLDIVGATQSIRRADVVFRELIQKFYGVRRIIAFRVPYSNYSFGFFSLVQYDPDSIESASRSYDRVSFMPSIAFIDPFTFSVYETSQEYQPTDPIGRREIIEYVMKEKTVIERHQVSRKSFDSPLSLNSTPPSDGGGLSVTGEPPTAGQP